MKPVAAIVLFIVLIIIGSRVFSFWAQERQLSGDLEAVQARLLTAKQDEANLRAEVQYLANPLNLEKELRARFNYRKPGETMVIIVPVQATASTSFSTH